MYYIQVISFDLRPEETILQAVNALDYLQASIDNAFDIIDKRIAEDIQKINSIQSRINIAAKKVTKLSSANKAIKILAPSKFPAANVLSDISVSFGVFPNISLELPSDYVIENNQTQCHNAFQNKLQFYHVKNHRKKYTVPKAIFEKHDVCLIPNYLKYVNSILLSNIYENSFSFKQSRKLLPDNYADNTRESGQQIVAAPTSITNRQINDKLNELIYMPKLSGAPNINLPLDLPDLPGIAVDVQFDSKDEPNIAPSLYTERPIPSKIPNPNEPKPPVMVTVPELKIENEEIKIECNTAVVRRPNPPPPPPPSPPILPEKVQTINNPQTMDVRSNLMDAIRKAGGAKGGKLRNSSIEEKTEKKISHNDKNNIASNLLDDLHNKLLMRRKGISGTKPTSDNVIERLSEIIPPLSAPQKDSSPETTDNDDWD